MVATETMRAAVRGGILGYTLTFRDTHPLPQPPTKPNEVLIEVHSAAINPIDYKLPRAALGAVYGLDVSGVVKSIGGADGSGSDSERSDLGLKIGDEVFGRASSGSLAEFAVASDAELTVKPNFLSHNEAASLGVAYLTGIQALRDAGKVKNGSAVLIIGASGGCGIAGVQLAKALGAERVVGICSGKNADMVKSLGADEVVDYTDSQALADFYNTNQGKFDCVYDTATGSGKKEDYTSQSMPLLSVDGEYVQINGGLTTWIRGMNGRLPKGRSLVLTSSNSRQNLEDIVSLLDKSGSKPLVNVMEFSDKGVNYGFELLKSRRSKGKIVFQVK